MVNNFKLLLLPVNFPESLIIGSNNQQQEKGILNKGDCIAHQDWNASLKGE